MIKFRVWDLANNCFFGRMDDLLIFTPPASAYNKFELFSLGKVEHFTGKVTFLKDSLDNYIIQQWTGLKDKNGKNIYEGDILTGREWFSSREPAWLKLRHVSVIFCNKSATYCLDYKFMQVPICGNLAYSYSDLEVVGNIYENPDLLK